MSHQQRNNRGFDGDHQFAARSDIDRLGVTAANEVGSTFGGLSEQVQQLQLIEDRVGEGAAVERASARSGRSSDRDAAQFERATRGLDLSDRQKRSSSRRLGLARSLNRAGAAGATRRGFADRSRAASQIQGAFGDALFGQRIDAETGISSAAGVKESAKLRRKANKTSSTLSTLGTLAGFALSFFSSEKLKDKQGPATNLLAKLKKVRIEKWNYKGSTRSHVGPFAEEFNDIFEVNQDNRGMINVIDALGVTLGAVKELDRKVEAHGI